MSIKEFFYFQKSDRKVITVAFCVAVVALAVVYFVGEGSTETNAGSAADTAAVAEKGEKVVVYDTAEGRELHLVPFDPNTADSTVLLGLGLQPWQVRNIYRYRSKGGIYRRPEDFARVYGLTVGQYRQLAPYIRISPDYRPAAEVYGGKRGGYSAYRGNNGNGWRQDGDAASKADDRADRPSPYQPPSQSRDTLRFPVKLKVGEHIDLNAADTTSLKRVPGVISPAGWWRIVSGWGAFIPPTNFSR